MADVYTEYDLELGLPMPSPMSKPWFETGCKEEVCGTPMSQATTAPSTPFHGHLLDPSYELPPFSFSRTTSAGASEGQPAESTTEEEIIKSFSSQQLKSDVARWAQAEVEAEEIVKKFSLQPLKSDVARWAEAQVEAEQLAGQLQTLDGESRSTTGSTTPQDVKSIGLQPLKSDLARWAKAQVEAEEWLEKRIQLKPDATPEEYIIDNTMLRAGTCGLAYRKSKCLEDVDMEVQGPLWGTVIEGTDDGDGWLKVGSHFLPMVLQGMSVVVQSPESFVMVDIDDGDEGCIEAASDGPAFTEDGQVVDLDGARPIFFSCDAQLSSGNSSKVVMIQALKAFQKAEMARAVAEAESEVLSEAVCSIDVNGEVRGTAALVPACVAKATSAAAADRLKKFHLKRTRKVVATNAQKPTVLSVDANGKVFIHLYLTSQGFHRKCAQLRRKASPTDTVMSIDCHGTIHDFPVADE